MDLDSGHQWLLTSQRDSSGPPNGNTCTTYEAVLPKVESDPDQASGFNNLFTRNAGNQETR